jgi:hypothetical protein
MIDSNRYRQKKGFIKLANSLYSIRDELIFGQKLNLQAALLDNLIIHVGFPTVIYFKEQSFILIRRSLYLLNQ